MNLAKDTTDSQSCSCWMSFLVDLSMKIETMFFAQMEAVGTSQTLFILMRGLLAGKGRIYYRGCVWGEDFILHDCSLAYLCEATTLTYVELASLSRQTFLDVVEEHAGRLPELPRLVRYHCCWLALQRSVRREVQRRKASMSIKDRGPRSQSKDRGPRSQRRGHCGAAQEAYEDEVIDATVLPGMTN